MSPKSIKMSAFALLAIVLTIYLDQIAALLKILPGASILGEITLSDRIYFLTLLVLIIYAWDTHKIASQTADTNLRPIILRSQFLDWKEIRPWQKEKMIIDENSASNFNKYHRLEFRVKKNIATSIKGKIIVNGFEYDLYFLHDINQRAPNIYAAMKFFGWLASEEIFFAFFYEDEGKTTDKKNRITLTYQDIEKNKYQSIEDEKSQQSSIKTS